MIKFLQHGKPTLNFLARPHPSRSLSKVPNLYLASIGAWANTSRRNMSASSPEELIESLKSVSLNGHDGPSGPHEHDKEPDDNVTQPEGSQRVPKGSDNGDDASSYQSKDSTKIHAQAAPAGYVKAANRSYITPFRISKHLTNTSLLRSCNENDIDDDSEASEEDCRPIRYGAPPQDFAWTHGLVPHISMNTDAARTPNLDPEVFIGGSSSYPETTADLNFVNSSPALNYQYKQYPSGDSGFSSNTISNPGTS